MSHCPDCHFPVDPAWRFCPMCATALPSRALPPVAALLELADADLQTWLARTERPDLVRALADPAWEPLKLRVLANLPSGARHILEDEWSYLHPDEEATARAQRALLNLAADLQELGVLVLPEPNDAWVTLGTGLLHLDEQLEAVVAAMGAENIRWALPRIDKRTLILCLFAASPAMKAAFYSEMSTRAVALMEEEIHFQERLPLAEIETAREALWAILAESGEPRI